MIFSAHAEAPSRSVLVSSWTRVSCGLSGLPEPSRRLAPKPTEAHDGRRVFRPSGLRGFSPADNPAPPRLRSPQFQPPAGKRVRYRERRAVTTGRPAIPRFDRAPPHVRVLGPGRLPPRDGTRAHFKGAGHAGANKVRQRGPALDSLRESGRRWMTEFFFRHSGRRGKASQTRKEAAPKRSGGEMCPQIRAWQVRALARRLVPGLRYATPGTTKGREAWGRLPALADVFTRGGGVLARYFNTASIKCIINKWLY
jgi:hypothetical protein